MERKELSDTEKAENAEMKIRNCFAKILEGVSIKTKLNIYMSDNYFVNVVMTNRQQLLK